MKYVRWPTILSTVNWWLRHVDDERAKAFVARTLPKHMLARWRRYNQPSPLTDIAAVVVADQAIRGRMPRGPFDVLAEAKRVREEALQSRPFFDFETGPPYTTPEDERARDWLNSIGDRDLDKLPAMTWQQALDASERWHATLRRQAERKRTIAGDEDTADRIESADGHYWVRLTTRNALDREGAAMGNCVGRGGYDVHVDFGGGARAGGIWSLRDADGRSVLTAEVVRVRVVPAGSPASLYKLMQVSRFGNARPRPEDRAHVEVLEEFYANLS